MGYSVTGLSSYVEVNKNTLIRDVVLGYKLGDTISKMRKQLGIKETERLNYLDVTPVLQDGKGCGFSAQGSTNFSEREITTKLVKVNDAWCADDLIGKYAEFLVRYGADANAEDFPFEREIMDELSIKLDQKLERIVWQGDASLSIQGLVELAEDVDSASTIFVDFAEKSADTMYKKVKEVIMAIPEELLDNAVVFISPANFRTLVFELLEQNNFHIEPKEIEAGEFYFPGTTIPVHKTLGLAGVEDKIYSSVWDNMVYGTDMMNDKEEFRTWFSDDDDLHKIKIKFNLGVNTLYPDAVVLGK